MMAVSPNVSRFILIFFVAVSFLTIFVLVTVLFSFLSFVCVTAEERMQLTGRDENILKVLIQLQGSREDDRYTDVPYTKIALWL